MCYYFTVLSPCLVSGSDIKGAAELPLLFQFQDHTPYRHGHSLLARTVMQQRILQTKISIGQPKSQVRTCLIEAQANGEFGVPTLTWWTELPLPPSGQSTYSHPVDRAPTPTQWLSASATDILRSNTQKTFLQSELRVCGCRCL